MTGNRHRRAPPPLPEAERRAWLHALGIPVWLPRDHAACGTDAAGAGQGGAAVTAEPVSGQQPSVAVPEAGVSATGDGGEAGASAQAVEVMDWPELQRTVLGCRQCELCETRTQAVFGVGSRSADLLIIGEAPGQEEDRRGEPFVGRAGNLLDRMLAAIHLERETVYITNVLKCRPPRNRDPAVEEVQACSGYLRRQITLLQPRVILAVGRVSAQQLLETDEPIGRLRGRWHQYGPGGTPLAVTYHPAYLLRRPGEKAKAWADLKRVRDALGITGRADGAGPAGA